VASHGLCILATTPDCSGINCATDSSAGERLGEKKGGEGLSLVGCLPSRLTRDSRFEVVFRVGFLKQCPPPSMPSPCSMLHAWLVVTTGRRIFCCNYVSDLFSNTVTSPAPTTPFPKTTPHRSLQSPNTQAKPTDCLPSTFLTINAGQPETSPRIIRQPRLLTSKPTKTLLHKHGSSWAKHPPSSSLHGQSSWSLSRKSCIVTTFQTRFSTRCGKCLVAGHLDDTLRYSLDLWRMAANTSTGT